MALSVRNVDWDNGKQVLRKIRERVFVCEWRIPQEYEFDHQDNSSHHVLLVDDNEEVATGRVTVTGELGRLAVIPKFRCPEVYRTLLNALVDVARKQGLQQISLQCELDGVDYYQQQGFKPVGRVYMDAGIPRQRMARDVSDLSFSNIELTH